MEATWLVRTFLLVIAEALIFFSAFHHYERHKSLSIIIGTCLGLFFMAASLNPIIASYKRSYMIKSSPDLERESDAKCKVVSSIFEVKIAVAYNEYPQLGQKRGCPRVFHSMSIGEYDHATVLWEYDDRRIYFLYSDDTWGIWEEKAWCNEADLWCVDKSSNLNGPGRKFFGRLFGSIPKDRFPPYGAIAYYLKDHPEQFEKIGWLKWHCQVEFDNTFIQEFENGVIIGVIPASLHNSSNGWIYILLKEALEGGGKTLYFHAKDGGSAPPCAAPQSH